LPDTDVDYGDAPDLTSATAQWDYQTERDNNGASHGLGAANAPYLGLCVDGDSGVLNSGNADADDLDNSSINVGNCTANDDEDGVVFNTSLIAGQATSITISANTSAVGNNACKLNAWIDYNQNGDWSDPGEQITAIDQNINSDASITITPIVPINAEYGSTYARFRCSTAGGDSSIGAAFDGEVEDYRVYIQPDPTVVSVDFGDAPDSYKTLLASDGAKHIITGPYLGAGVDSETDGQPSSDALGDGSDEDGVSFPVVLNASSLVNLPVTVTGSCLLDAWIDFNGDGDWADSGEQIFTSESLVNGVNSLSVTIPAATVNGISYARFRCSTEGALSYTGTALDGEVEDYQVIFQALPSSNIDYGDAPDLSPATAQWDYQTKRDSNGASHGLGGNAPYLGSCVDSDNGLHNGHQADVDDLDNSTSDFGTCIGDDDEDGVTFNGDLIAGQTASISISSSLGASNNTCKLNAWIDYNQDGDWTDSGEQIGSVDQLINTNSSITITPLIPLTAKHGPTFARFRCSTAGGDSSIGAAFDGEVEDYRVYIEPDPTAVNMDFGDAPDSYQTLLGSDGARHIITGLFLGSSVDNETDGQASTDALGDGNDEDGVNFPVALHAGDSITLPVISSGACKLDAWIDFNADGDWADTGEQVFTNMSLISGTNSLTLNVPVNVVNGATYARFRCSTEGSLSYTGNALDGEIEDYRVIFQALPDTNVDYVEHH